MKHENPNRFDQHQHSAEPLELLDWLCLGPWHRWSSGAAISLDAIDLDGGHGHRALVGVPQGPVNLDQFTSATTRLTIDI